MKSRGEMCRERELNPRPPENQSGAWSPWTWITSSELLGFFLFENSINYYIHKSSVTFQPCKITMTYFEILIDKWNCNISCLMCGLMTTN